MTDQIEIRMLGGSYHVFAGDLWVADNDGDGDGDGEP